MVSLFKFFQGSIILAIDNPMIIKSNRVQNDHFNTLLILDDRGSKSLLQHDFISTFFSIEVG